jgi:hypothetical protein
MINLDSRVGVIVLTNAGDSNPFGMAQQLMNSVGEAVAKGSAARPTVVAWDPQWARFAGLYRSRFGDTQVVLLDKRLVLLSPAAQSLDNLDTLEPIGDGRFRLVARTGGGNVGEVVRFVDEGGRVVRMYVADNWSDRVPDSR